LWNVSPTWTGWQAELTSLAGKLRMDTAQQRADTLKRLGLFLGPIVIVNTRGYYDPLIAQLAAAIDRRFMDTRHDSMWTIVGGADEVLPAIEAAAKWSEDSRGFAVVR
jgi:hypothetical protein